MPSPCQGFNEYDYQNVYYKDKLHKCETCERYFWLEMFGDQFKVANMKTCKHCYFVLNSYKYSNNNSTDEDINKLQDYINRYYFYHNEQECLSKLSSSHCYLCDAKNGIFPNFCERNGKIINEKLGNNIIIHDELSFNNIDLTNEIILRI